MIGARVSGLAFAAFLVALGGGRARAALDIDEAEGLLEDWQLEDALSRAETLLKQRPEDPEVWVLAGKVLHQKGEHLAAKAMFEAALDKGLTVDEVGYVGALVERSAAYAAHFETLETPHFRIRYLNKDEIVAQLAAPVLEAAYSRIGAALEMLPAERGEKITVEVYPDARGLAGATGLTIKEIETSGTIAVCKFHRLMITSPLATADGYSWGDTLAHEYVHLLVSKKSHNSIPIWLHEGIAKYYESAWKGGAGEALGAYSETLLAEAARTGKFITYAQMHPSMAKLPSQKDAALAFAEVFTTIEFLVQKYGAASIPKVLEATGRGVSLERALLQTFGLDLNGIEAAWRKYVVKRKFQIVPGASKKTIRLAENEDESKKERPLEEIADREVHDFSRLGELLQMRGRHAAAVMEYEKAYGKAGLRYPTLTNRLARGYVEVGRLADAQTLLDKALVAHPEDGDAHLLAGRIAMGQKDSARAEVHYRSVALQNPFNPEVHAALIKVYEELGQKSKIEQHKRFLQLSEKPRPTRTYELPPPPAGSARLRVVTPRFARVRIAGRAPQASPAWDVPVEAGEIVVEYLRPAGDSVPKTVRVGAGETALVVFD